MRMLQKFLKKNLWINNKTKKGYVNHGSFVFYDGGLLLENLYINNGTNIIRLLNSVADRMNIIILCLPDMLQKNMDDLINSFSYFLKKLYYIIDDFCVENFTFLYNACLYMELSIIFSQLEIFIFNTLI